MTTRDRIFIAALFVVAALIAFFAFRFLNAEEPLQTEALLSFEAGPEAAIEPAPSPATRPRNLILLIGDGMGFSHLQVARTLLHGPNGRLALETFPVTGWSHTHSVGDIYTDSAAGATALATGVKTVPGAVSVDAAGAPLKTLFEAAGDAGKAVGVLTDSAFFDATPAAFLAHRESRRETLAVIEDMTSSGADLIVGESRSRLEEHEEWPGLATAIEGRGFSMARSLDELQASSGPVLGLIEQYTIADSNQGPHLVDLASWAVDRLAADPEGFVLMIETEETDTASHQNNLERMVEGVGALDRIAKQMVDRFGESADTLILITADHETGGLAIYDGGDGEPLRYDWATQGHTAEPVPVLAWGPGSELFSGVHDNTEIGTLLATALGLECCGWSAPEAPEESGDRPESAPHDP